MISIITPAYIDTIEKLEWLNEMIASVKSQSITDWELIIMDDASPMPINLYDADERVRTLRMVNRTGPSLCRASLNQSKCLRPIRLYIAIVSFQLCILPVTPDAS